MLPSLSSLRIADLTLDTGVNGKMKSIFKVVDSTIKLKKTRNEGNPLHKALDELWSKASRCRPPKGMEKFTALNTIWEMGDENNFRTSWKNLRVGTGEFKIKNKNDTAWTTKKIANVNAAGAEFQLAKFKEEVRKTLSSREQQNDGHTVGQIATALLRYWFNKDGRVWYHTKISHASTFVQKEYTDVPGQTHDARQQWAEQVVIAHVTDGKLTLDPIPMPPLKFKDIDLWIKGYDVIPKELLPASAPIEDYTMPRFNGPTYAFSTDEAYAELDGAHILKYVKEVEEQLKKQSAMLKEWATSKKTELQSTFVGNNNTETMFDMYKTQIMLNNSYNVFMSDLRTLGKNVKELFVEKNYTYDYTDGSSGYNFPLRYSKEAWKPLFDFLVIKKKSKEDFLTSLSTSVPLIQNELPYNIRHLITVEKLARSLKNIHGLWKLLAAAPRAPHDFTVLRSEDNTNNLPHKLVGVETPEPGQKFVLPSFTSTTVATIDSYWNGDTALSAFFNESTKCCIYAIRVLKDTPIIPAFVAGCTKYSDEKEVILSPLTTLVYLGIETINFPDEHPNSVPLQIHTYAAYAFEARSVEESKTKGVSPMAVDA